MSQTTTPITHGVQIVRFDEHGEPWPVATIYIDGAGRCQFSAQPGPNTDVAASKAYGPLLTATKKASSLIAEQSLREALAEQSLREALAKVSGSKDATPSPTATKP